MAAAVVQTTFAAISFAGAGYLFKLFDKNGYEAEMKHHNKALEDFARSKEKFYEDKVKPRDKIQQLKEQLRDVNVDIKNTNDALWKLHEYERQISIMRKKKPKLDNFYKPSDEMADNQTLVVGAMGAGIGLVVKGII